MANQRESATWGGCVLMLIGLLTIMSCSKSESTDELVGDLGSAETEDRVKAVRLLQSRTGDSTKIVPALIESLKDKSNNVRRSAAIGLGYFGADAMSAVPALEQAKRDSDAKVREAVGVAISRIQAKD